MQVGQLPRRIADWLGERNPIDVLNGRRFTSRQVCEAADVTDDGLTNLISKSKIHLYSPSPGQGRAREFCLIDVYNITMICRLVRVIRLVKPVDDSLRPEYLSTARPDDQPLCSAYGPIAWDQVCADIYEAPSFYTDRDYDRAMYLIFEEAFPFPVLSREDPLRDHGIHLACGALLNITLCLRHVDLRLIGGVYEEEGNA